MKTIKETVYDLLDNYLQSGEYHNDLNSILGHDDYSHILADFKNEFYSLECDPEGATLEQIEQLEKIQKKYVDILLSTKRVTLRDIIISKRKELNLSQAELAVKSGITQSQISLFESGKADLTSTSVDKLIDALRISFSKNQAEQWELAEQCAQTLKLKGIKDASEITKEELAEIVGCEDILLLQVVSEKLYNKYVTSRIINEHHTYNYFLTLVNLNLACSPPLLVL